MKIPFTNYELTLRRKTVTRQFPAEMEDIPDLKVLMPQWMVRPPYGLVREMRNGEIFNAKEIRLLGHSTYVWQCKKRIADAVVSCPWQILPNDPDRPNKQMIKKIDSFLRYHPNENNETFNTIIFSVMMDILDLDAGIIVKVFGKYAKNKLLQIYSRDGSTILKEVDKYGRLVKYWQYDYRTIEPVEIPSREIVYLSRNPRSDSPYGESPLETIMLIVRNLVKGVEMQELIHRKGGIPSGIIALEGMGKEDFDAFKAWWQDKMKNKVYQRAMVNVPAKWLPLITSFRDLEFLDTQKWFAELVYRTFGVPPEGLGVRTREAKGAPQEVYRKFMKETVLPYLQLTEQAINQQIIPHFYPEGKQPDVHFRYTIIDHMQELEEMELWDKRWSWGSHTINEYRVQKQLKPLSWGDLNPLAIKNLQNISQSWWYGAFTSEAFTMITGIPTPTEAIRQALKGGKQGETEQT